MSEVNQLAEIVEVSIAELTPWTGIALKADERQIALFYFPSYSPYFFAVDNSDPIGGANVLSRGILGDVKGEPVIASPLYKQHFSLVTGFCIEQPDVQLKTYAVTVSDQCVTIHL
jgi:nitrite reductase (NADH) small subunit